MRGREITRRKIRKITEKQIMQIKMSSPSETQILFLFAKRKTRPMLRLKKHEKTKGNMEENYKT